MNFKQTSKITASSAFNNHAYGYQSRNDRSTSSSESEFVESFKLSTFQTTRSYSVEFPEDLGKKEALDRLCYLAPRCNFHYRLNPFWEQSTSPKSYCMYLFQSKAI